MSVRGASIVGVGAAALLLFCGQASAQASAKTNASASVRSIDVTGRPIPEALDVIEQRYGVSIDYSDPIYTSTQDTQLLYTLHCSLCSVAKLGEKTVGGKPPVMGPHDVPLRVPILVPRIWTLKIQYLERSEAPRVAPYFHCNLATIGCPTVSARPVGGITALIRKVLTGFADEGGSVFTVRKIATRYGPRWEVYPLKARNSAGAFVLQPDYLGTTIRLPASTHAGAGVVDAVAKQLTRRWNVKFEAGSIPLPADIPFPEHAIGRRLTMLARQALLGVAGPTSAIRMFYDPASASYAISISPMPYREPSRPPTPAPVPARVLPPRPYWPIDWVLAAHVPKGNFKVQTALAKAGYLHTAPTKKWDANAIAALRRFQAANGLPPTGDFDIKTARKLLPFLPDAPARVVPAKPAMDPQLAYWLESTPDGRKEIAEALKKAGFYKGPITDSPNNPEAEAALKAFQKANDLPPNGWFTYQTAEKLAPFLPQPKN